MFNIRRHKNITHTAICVPDPSATKKRVAKNIAIHATVVVGVVVAKYAVYKMLSSDTEN